MMKNTNFNIFKICDEIYGKSIQEFPGSYLRGFPQRDLHLKKDVYDYLGIKYFRHGIINVKTIEKERIFLYQFLENLDSKLDAILIDNPLSFLILPNNIIKKTLLIFDMIDWYEDMYRIELGDNSSLNLVNSSLKMIMKRADGLIVQSPIMFKYACELGFDKKKPYVVIPNGYDHNIFYPFSSQKLIKIKETISLDYNINFTNKIIVVYQGKMGKWYGGIESFIRNINDDKKIIGILVGEGPLKERFQKIASKNIFFTGFMKFKDVSRFTNIADCCVFPVNDCSPIAISEYIGVKKPIISLGHRISWLIKDGINGYIVDKDHEWKEKIIKAYKNKEVLIKNNEHLSNKLKWSSLSKYYRKFILKTLFNRGE